MWPYVVSIFTILVQLTTLTSEDFGGLSGQDSLIQAFVATFDASTGILFTLGASKFILDQSRWKFLNFPRWNLLHSKPEDTHQQIKISFRASPWPLAEKVDRIGRLYRKNQSNDGSTHVHWEKTAFAQNLNAFVVPFLKQTGSLDNLPPEEIVFNEYVLQHAAADSLIRLLCVITLSLAFFIMRITIHSIYTSNWIVSVIIILAELLRAFTAIAQEISVFTYSCAYKGTRTWAWPANPSAPQRDTVSTPGKHVNAWTRDQQEEFERLVWKRMSLLNPGRAVFWILTLVRSRAGGPASTFRSWATPSPGEYRSDSNELRLEVVDPNPHGGEEKVVHETHFRNVPTEIIHSLDLHLCAEKVEWGLGVIYLVSSFFNVFLPALFISFHPYELARVYYSLEQIAAKIMRYYDPVDLSVNTTFKTVIHPYDGV